MNREKTSNKTVAGRRGFLMGAGLAGAAGAAVVATRGGAAQGTTAEAKPQTHERGGGGYHVTDHVRRYYRSTTV
ncbi:MAG: formate dehydrogenase [Burkholderiales bacterium]|nr:MAG: formate dehydrogenase [Pseudomonadota bacterium]MCZ2413484.1 formate dehydrogenase [Burkholderiales bacterium]